MITFHIKASTHHFQAKIIVHTIKIETPRDPLTKLWWEDRSSCSEIHEKCSGSIIQYPQKSNTSFKQIEGDRGNTVIQQPVANNTQKIERD